MDKNNSFSATLNSYAETVIYYANKVLQYPKGSGGYDPVDASNLKNAIESYEWFRDN
jgi:phosphoserine aminotransferase